MTTGKDEHDERVREFNKAEENAAVAQRKKQNETALEDYRAAQQRKKAEDWERYKDEVRKQGLVKDAKGNDVKRDEMFDHTLEEFLKQGANTTSDWRSALMEVLKLLAEFVEMLSAKKGEAKIELYNRLTKKLGEEAERYQAETEAYNKAVAEGRPATPPSQATAIKLAVGEFLLNPENKPWKLSSSILFKIKGDAEAPLPKFQHRIDFKDGKMTIDPLTAKTGTPIDETVNVAFKQGVELWLEQEGYKLNPDNTVQKPDGTLISDAAEFNDLKAGKGGHQPFADFLAGKAKLQYEEREDYSPPTPN
jgi:hypothetical protein